MLSVGEVAPGSVILVCDDERHIVRLIKVNLERQGYTVLEAFDGKEALEILRTVLVDLLVIDGDMTCPSTNEILAQMRTIAGRENVPVRVLSKRGSDQP
jgi:two-component system alkaline phosphatase synthesis response regulator PhoP